MASINNDSVLKSQISDQDPNQKTTSVRNIVIGLVGFIFAVSCILTYAYKDQIFGSEDVLALDENDSSIKNSNKNISEKKNIANNDLALSTVEGKQKEIGESNKTNGHKIETKEKGNEKNKRKQTKIIENGDSSNYIENKNKDYEIGSELIESGKENENNFEDPDTNDNDNSNNEEENLSSKSLRGNIIFLEILENNNYFNLKSFSLTEKTQKDLQKALFNDNKLHCRLPTLSFDCEKIAALDFIGETYDNRINLIKIKSLDSKDSKDFTEIFTAPEQKLQIGFDSSPYFNPAGNKIIFTGFVDKKIYVTDINENSSSNHDELEIFKEFDENLDLRECKYTQDGLNIICLVFDDIKSVFKFYVIQISDRENVREIIVDFNSIQSNFSDTNRYQSDNICICSFSVSPDSSKIVFNLSVSCVKSIFKRSFKREIHAINFNNGDYIKKVYEAELGGSVPDFLLTAGPVWSPDSKFIFFSDVISSEEKILTLKRKEIDSESAAEELRNIDGSPINGHVLGLSLIEEKKDL